MSPRESLFWMCCAMAAQLLSFSASQAQQPLPGPVQPGQIEKQFEPPVTPPVPPPAVIPPLPQPPERLEQEGLRFALSRVTVEGASVYSEAQLRPYYEQYLGQEVGLAELNAIARELTARYRGDGYLLSRVVVPAQTVVEGSVRLQAIEGFVSELRFAGDRLADDGLLRAHADAITRPRPLHSSVLERHLLLMNDLPGLTAQATLAPAPGQPGAAELTISLSQRKFAGTAAINNRGSRSLGPWRADFSAGIFSVFGPFDQVALRAVTTGANNELHYVSADYDRPIAGEGARLGFSASGVEAEPPLGAAFPNIATSSRSATLTLTHPFLRSRSRNLYLRGSLSAHNAETDILGLPFSEDRIRAIRIGTAYDFLDASGVNVIDAELSQGLDILGARETGSPNLSRPEGRSNFTKLNLSAARLHSLAPGWSLLAVIEGQYAFNDLLSPEEFAFGGEQFGRGFDASELVGDSGSALKIELRYTGTGDVAARYMPYAFYDIGQVWRRNPAEAEKRNESAASAGFGVRFNLTDRLSGYAELAKPLTREVVAEGNKEPRIFVGLALAY